MRKCLYNKEVNSYLIDYGKDFLTTYSEFPKYLELNFLDAHEGTGDALNYLDDPLRGFMDWLEQSE
jgi:hypothetical protein